ncbi:sigS mRNA-stabilizing protein SroA [Staphylococcus cohnii]|uniref:sigS mRNA-stabilizing protein SroA n=1 Tax=Staphylococcus cohnii TaxID=29382 RepID=UPI003ABE12FA
MNQISHLAVTMSRVTYDKDGKATQFKRHFANLNTQATTDQIKSFKSIIEQITGEKFETVEIIKTETVN